MKTENIGCFSFLHCMIKTKCELIQLLTPSQLCYEEKTAVEDSYTGFLKQNHPNSHTDTTAVFPLNILCTRLLFTIPLQNTFQIYINASNIGEKTLFIKCRFFSYFMRYHYGPEYKQTIQCMIT